MPVHDNIVTAPAMKIINWETARKEYPELVQQIQNWFNGLTGIDTKVWFYNQRAWRNEVLPVWLKQAYGLKIMYDVAWVSKKQSFNFIYAIIDGEKAVPPQQTFAERIQAEHFAYAHVLQYIKDKNAGVENAEVIDEIIGGNKSERPKTQEPTPKETV